MALRIDRRAAEGAVVELGDLRMELWVQEIAKRQPPSTLVAFDVPEGVSVVVGEREGEWTKVTGRVLLSRLARESIAVKMGETSFRIWVNRIDCFDRGGPWVRLIFDAPREVRILRDELIGRE